MRRPRRESVLATVLFTDIVGSSRIASELGDRRWRVLLDAHHAIVRRQLKLYGGRELDTAGDGFFAVFDEPSRAIRGACAISDGVRVLGIEVRAGLNLGESELIGAKLGGIAVHAAARIMSLAGPGDVLVASTVKDLVPGSGFDFVDRGVHELRDVPGAWHLFAVVGVDGQARAQPLEQEEAKQRRDAIRVPPLLRRRAGGLVAGVAGTAAIGVLLAILLLARGTTPKPAGGPSPKGATEPSSHAAERPDEAVEIDPQSGATVASIPVGKDPGDIAFGEGSVWVTNNGDGTVTRIDPVTHRAETIGEVPDAGSIAVTDGAAWVSSDANVLKIDPSTNRIGQTLTINGDQSGDVVVEPQSGSVWVVEISYGHGNFGDHYAVARLDPFTSTFIDELTNACCYSGVLTAGAGHVWFATDSGRVVEFDATTGHVEFDHTYEGEQFWQADLVGDTLWLSTGTALWLSTGTALLPVDVRTHRRGRQVPLGGEGMTGIAALGFGIYASDSDGGVDTYISGQVGSQISTPASATSIAAGDGKLWVSVNRP